MRTSSEIKWCEACQKDTTGKDLTRWYNESMSQSDFTKPADRGERVPLSLVMPYAQAYLDRFSDGRDSVAPMLDREKLLADHPEWAGTKEATPVLLLAERARLSPSTLSKWLRAKGGTIGFYDADAILIASGAPGTADSLLSFDASEQEGSE